jgi:hypothetical protein
VRPTSDPFAVDVNLELLVQHFARGLSGSSQGASSPALLLPSAPLAGLKVGHHMSRLLHVREVIKAHKHATSIAVASGSDAAERELECTFYPVLCCHLLMRTLRSLPALSRTWFSSADHAVAGVVSRLCAAAFSPLLIRQELLALQNFPSTDEFRVRIDFDRSEVSARYLREELDMGLTLQLPPLFPLHSVQSAFTEKIRINESWAKKWQLSILSILNSSDGTLSDALACWHTNVEAQLRGVESCVICYSMVDSATRQLPRMQCKECGNRFHATCLFKWFHSSGASRCPLCRSLF